MGQKANPKGLRLGIVRDWESNWFSTHEYKDFIIEDLKIKKFINEELQRASIAEISINRKSDYINIYVKVSRPGVILGKNGMDMTLVKKDLEKLVGKSVNINIVEEKSPDLSSRLLANWVAQQLERRVPFRRAMKMDVQRSLKSGAQGIKIATAGRLGGVEIARTEWYREGKVPLHTLRADIDYAFTEALTTYGKIGVKVWIYKGDILDKNIKTLEQEFKKKKSEKTKAGA